MSIRTPEGLALRDYQITGVKHLLSGKRKLLLDDMGLGKTAQLIVAFNSLGARSVLIICPPAVTYSWQDEIERWSVRNYDTHIVTTRLQRIPDMKVIIVPYSLVAHPNILGQLMARTWGVLGIDEIHFCKNSGAKRTKAVLHGKSGLFSRAIYKWGLSGTAMTNTPKDLWPIFSTIGREFVGKYRTKDKFEKRYCVMAGRWPQLRVVGAKHLDELNSKLFDTGLALMRHKTDVLTELPPKQYRLMPIEGEALLSVDVGQRMDNSDFEDASLGMEAGQLATVRRELGAAKVGPVCRYIKQMLDEEGKMIVFAWHKEVIEALRDELWMDDIKAVTYYGEMTSRLKEEAKRQFINDPSTSVFIGNIASAGTGLNGLQAVCSYAMFAETPWTYTEIAQASDRLHRFGQQCPVLIDMLVLTDSIEEYVVRKVLEKEGYFNQTFSTERKLIRN